MIYLIASVCTLNTCPHCLGCNCIHCRELRTELRRRQRYSRLTPEDRHNLALLSRPLRVKPLPTATVLGAHRMVPVLPRNFSLP